MRTHGKDNTLVARAAAGDEAFAELVRRHQNRVFGFILRMIGSRDEAMDLTQEVFMKAWQTLPDWRSGCTPFHLVAADCA